MYAVIETGGKQYKVCPGEVLRVEKLSADVGQEVSIPDVLMIVDDSDVKIGRPLLEGASVTAEVVEHGLGRKVKVFKKRRRKGYRVNQGHRQPFTSLAIKKIEA